MSSDNSLSLILRRITPGAKVLEFGPALGYMTQYLKQELGCTVYCIEIDPEAAEVASRYCDKMIVADLDNLSNWGPQLKDEQFDFLIFADVLEHLRNPWEVLKFSNRFLSKEGKVLTSIPNIGHNAVLMKLLLGEFDYRDLGLLDNTHIRFFTRKSVQGLLNYAGLKPVESLETVLKPEETELRQSYNEFPERLQEYLKKKNDGHVYQFVSVSEKKESISPSDIGKVGAENNPFNFSRLHVDIEGQEEIHSEKIPSNGGYHDYEFSISSLNNNKVKIQIQGSSPAFIEITKLQLLNEDDVIVMDFLKDDSLMPSASGTVKLESLQTLRFLTISDEPCFILHNNNMASFSGNYRLRINLCLSEQIPATIGDEIRALFDELFLKRTEVSSLRSEKLKIEEAIRNTQNQIETLQDAVLELRNEMNYKQEEVTALGIKYNNLVTEKEELIRNNDSIHKRLEEILNSRSWRYLSPVRSGMNMIRNSRKNANTILKNRMKPVIVKAENSSLVRKVHSKTFNMMRRTPEPFRSHFKRVYYKLLSSKNKIKYQDVINEIPESFENVDLVNPLVSIIIPVYNNKAYISSCIDSALNQTYENIEIVIVDDCSPEQEVEQILNRYKGNKKIKIYKNERNQGISRTQNICLAKSSGSIIAFLDCDDILEPNAVERSLSYWTADTKYSFSNRIHINENSEEIGRFSCDHLPKENIFEDHLDVRMYASHFKMISRDVFLKVGVFNPDYDGAQDYDMVLRVAFHYPNASFVHVPEFLYKHRIHTNQKSIRSNDKQKNMSIFISDQAKMRRSIRDGVFHKLLSFIIISFGKEDQTLQCIQSIKKTVKVPHEIILFDNGSSEECVSFIRENIEGIENVKVIYHPTNLGPAGGRKEALKYASKDAYYISLDNDIEVTSGWIEELLVRAEESDDIGSVTCRVAFPSGVLQFTGGYEEISGNRIQFKLYNINKSVYDLSTLERYETDWNPVGATLFKGWFPEVEGYPNVYEDSAISYLLRKSGKRLVNSPNSLLIHHHIMFDEERNKKETDYLAFRYNPSLMLRSLAQFYFDNNLIIDDDYIYSTNNIDISKLTDEQVISMFNNLK